MAIESVTKAVEFDFSPRFDRHLFSVLEGHDAEMAQLEASCLESGARKLLLNCEGSGEALSGDVLHIVRFALDAAGALRDATGG